MKIGILTFHWATNYGAVLQAYALKTTIEKYNDNVRVIDYYPRRYKKNLINSFVTKHISMIPSRIRAIKKDKNIEIFREKYFQRTKYFSKGKNLKKQLKDFDCFICGSDQIWNMSFAENGEGKKTFTYFLDFADAKKILASYAASFGALCVKETLKEDITKYIKRMDFVSVRERSGVEIVKDLGIEKCELVPDPTLLLEPGHYQKMAFKNSLSGKYAFLYMLHNKQKDADSIIESLKNKGLKLVISGNEEVEQWLSYIKNAEIVISNSFHAIVFSILFKTPFVAILIKNSPMNDRINTLLGSLDLENRIYNGDNSILDDNEIDWEAVHQKIEQKKDVGHEYIKKIIEYKKEK